NAWTWEHQSLTRARFICGTPEIQTAFDRIRTEMLTAERDQTALAGEIIEAGSLYETDLRLRPNGDAGFLAHSIAAFGKYQR
ncbi:TPA: hypothetical protein ACFIWD_002173, partial [Neisseria gonorrhoeae]